MRRNWFVWAIVVGVLSIAVAALVMRLTADESASPTAEEWAESVCSSLAGWKASIQSLAEVDAGSLSAETLTERIDEAKAATASLTTELEALGPPDLESGEDLRQQLSAAVEELRSSVDTLAEGARQAAEAGSPAEFLQELALLAPQFQALVDAASATVDELRMADVAEDAKAELDAAFAGAPSCQQLRTDR